MQKKMIQDAKNSMGMQKTRFQKPKTRFSGILLEWIQVHLRRKKKPVKGDWHFITGTTFMKDGLDGKKCKANLRLP